MYRRRGNRKLGNRRDLHQDLDLQFRGWLIQERRLSVWSGWYKVLCSWGIPQWKQQSLRRDFLLYLDLEYLQRSSGDWYVVLRLHVIELTPAHCRILSRRRQLQLLQTLLIDSWDWKMISHRYLKIGLKKYDVIIKSIQLELNRRKIVHFRRKGLWNCYSSKIFVLCLWVSQLRVSLPGKIFNSEIAAIWIRFVYIYQ